MRAPVRSESDAFRLTFATALAIAVSVLIGWLTAPVVGVLLFVLMALVATYAYVRAGRRDRPPVLRDASREAHRHGAAPGKRHVLVVANEALDGQGILDAIADQDHGRVEVDVLAPVLTSRVHLGVTDIDRELAQARDRLARSLQWAHDHGLVARGEVGDPDPTTALEDELRDFGADQVIVVTHPRDRETWQERQELSRLRHELDVPVTHVVIEESGDDLIA